MSNQWFEPLNWEPEGVPVSTDDVYICPDAIGQPSQTRDAITVHDLLVPEGAHFTNSSPLVRVRVFGELDATGGIDGLGPVNLLGGTIKGTVHRVEVWEPSSLAGDATITDRITINEPSGTPEADGDASLALSGHTLSTQVFSCCVSGVQGLTMDDPGDRLVIEDTANFSYMTTGLSAGEIVVGGNVVFCASGLASPFESAGTKVIVNGQTPQSLFGNNDCASGSPGFADLELLSPAELSTNMPIRVHGDLVIPQGATMSFNRGSSFEGSGISGDVDLSGRMNVALGPNVNLSLFGTLKLNATGVLDTDGSLIVSVCDPKDGTIIGDDPCP